MQPAIEVSPFKCRVWSLHSRAEDELTEETCKAVIQSFIDHGQLVPVLGRRISGDPKYEIELIYGARRLFASRHLNKPLLIEVRDLSDRDAIIAMDIENRLRKDISPYERGLSYARWLRSGHFRSQLDIAAALRISSSQVSRLLKLAQLPAIVADAFGGASNICETWGLDLMEALEDSDRRPATLQMARRLARTVPRLAPRNVYRKLLAPTIHKFKGNASSRDKVIVGANGDPLFRIKHQSKSISFIVHAERLSKRSLDQIETTLTGILGEGPADEHVVRSQRSSVGKIATLDGHEVALS